MGILPATILAADVCVIENLPDISDVAVIGLPDQRLGEIAAAIRHKICVDYL